MKIPFYKCQNCIHHKLMFNPIGFKIECQFFKIDIRPGVDPDDYQFVVECPRGQDQTKTY